MSLIPWKTSAGMPAKRARLGDELTNLQNEVNSMMNSFLNKGDLVTSFYPSIDLQEAEDKYLLDADMPGISEGNIDIDFHDNILTIKGERTKSTETSKEGAVYVERGYGPFRRDITFDESIDPEKIKAVLESGVLHVELIKRERTKSSHRKISIKQ
jgi:HSP20 family protein